MESSARTVACERNEYMNRATAPYSMLRVHNAIFSRCSSVRDVVKNSMVG